MTSTELFQGMKPTARPSSRVLKPPGGGHTSIFGDVEAEPNKPRPKYNQQNSSNLNQCMNTVDPNESVEKTRQELAQKATDQKNSEASEKKSEPVQVKEDNGNGMDSGKGRVPPGGFSSGGFW
uniref:Microtubule-associated protein Jupiter n=1 Tax=Megaselia scalaris TaxID=36166 RepID=T1H0U5_MEGSC